MESRRIILALASTMLLSLTACKKEMSETVQRATPINVVSATAHQNKEEVTITDGVVTIRTTKGTDLSNLDVSLFFDKEKVTVTYDGQEITDFQYIPMNLSRPQRIRVTEQGASSGNYITVKATTFTGLPIIRIENDGKADVTSKENYIKTSVTFDPNGLLNCDAMTLRGQIKGRGNSTWGDMPKKPYRIKLDKRDDIFGHATNRDWVLLANYADKTLLRNFIAFQMGEAFKMDFTPFGQFVEVYMNGKHLGNYLLTDQVEVSNHRVDGIFLIQIDKRLNENGNRNKYPNFNSTKFPFKINYPEEPTTAQKSEISTYVKEAEKVLFSLDYDDPDNGFRKYFDTQSIIQWAIINELFINPDAKDYSSIFFHQKEHNGKLYMGPIWDFDLGGGNYGYPGSEERNNPESNFFVMKNSYINRMRMDENFKQEMRQYWDAHKDDIMRIIENIDTYYEMIAPSVTENFKLWPKFDDGKWYTVAKQPKNYPGQLDYLKDFLERRFNWLDSNL